MPDLLLKGVKEILRSLHDSPKRFNQLVKDTCVNRRTISNRLLILEKEKMIERTLHNTKPPFALYMLTKRGRMMYELSVME